MEIDKQIDSRFENCQWDRLHEDKQKFTKLLIGSLFSSSLAGMMALYLNEPQWNAAFAASVGLSGTIAFLDFATHYRIIQIEKYVGLR